jgi:hypothetical protein
MVSIFVISPTNNNNKMKLHKPLSFTLFRCKICLDDIEKQLEDPNIFELTNDIFDYFKYFDSNGNYISSLKVIGSKLLEYPPELQCLITKTVNKWVDKNLLTNVFLIWN